MLDHHKAMVDLFTREYIRAVTNTVIERWVHDNLDVQPFSGVAFENVLRHINLIYRVKR